MAAPSSHLLPSQLPLRRPRPQSVRPHRRQAICLSPSLINISLSGPLLLIPPTARLSRHLSRTVRLCRRHKETGMSDRWLGFLHRPCPMAQSYRLHLDNIRLHGLRIPVSLPFHPVSIDTRLSPLLRQVSMTRFLILLRLRDLRACRCLG